MQHIATHWLQHSAKRKHLLLFQVDVVYSKITIIELKLWFNPVKAYSSLKKQLLKPLLFRFEPEHTNTQPIRVRESACIPEAHSSR